MKERNATKKPMKYVDKLKRLKAIYAQVPTFDCLPDCGKCCGPMPVHPFEYRVINNYIKANKLDIHIMTPLEHMALLKAIEDDPTVRQRLMHCSAQDPETMLCRIYPVRALVCRMYGSVPENPWNQVIDLVCPLKEQDPDKMMNPKKAYRLNQMVYDLEHW
jgi:Fe-S-cluster containining protein